jgi:rhodanese-related sulfurtransferase
MKIEMTSLLFSLLLLASCGAPQAEYRKINTEQDMAMMEQGQPYILLDTRTDEEFINQRIEGAVLIPEYEIADRAADELPDKDALILIYYRSGRRSAIAAHELVAMGYI